MAGRDEPDPAAPQGIQEGDYGMAAEAEHHLDTQLLQVIHKLVSRDPLFTLADSRAYDQIRSLHLFPLYSGNFGNLLERHPTALIGELSGI